MPRGVCRRLHPLAVQARTLPLRMRRMRCQAAYQGHLPPLRRAERVMNIFTADYTGSHYYMHRHMHTLAGSFAYISMNYANIIALRVKRERLLALQLLQLQ